MKNYIFLISTITFFSVLTHDARAELVATSTNIIEVGNVYNYQTLTNQFHFKNTGPNEIKILDLMSTCPCISGITDKKLIKPDEEFFLETYLDARTVHNSFSRGVWLVTTDPLHKRVMCRITGTVVPLFSGIPSEEIILQAKDENIIFTNNFTVTGIDTNYVLKQPEPNLSGPNTKVIVTDSGSNTYHVTTIIKPINGLRTKIFVKIPVEGPNRIDDIQLKFTSVIGIPLKASPSRITINSTDQAVTKRFYISAYSDSTNITELTWSPEIEGISITKEVTITKRPILGKLNIRRKIESKDNGLQMMRFLCTADISPEALKKLLALDEPGITFSYPSHKSVFIPLTTLAAGTEPQTGTK